MQNPLLSIQQQTLARRAGLGLAAFVLSLAAMLYLSSASRGYWPVGVDVYPYWNGARAMWQGENPYSRQVQFETQQLIYGRPARGQEDPFGFYYPAYAAIIFSPLTLIDVEWAGRLWSAAMGAIFIVLIFSWSWWLRPRPSPIIWAALLLTGLFFRPALFSIVEGQSGFFVIACGAAAWQLIQGRHDPWAGAILALTTIKPSLALFLPLAILLWSARQRRWGVWIGLVFALSILLTVTFVKLGWWVPDFLLQIGVFGVEHPGMGWTNADLVSLPGLVWLAVALALSLLGLRQMLSSRAFPWLALIGLLNLNLVLTPHLVEYDLAILLIPLLWLGQTWQHRRGGFFIWAVLMWIPWIGWMGLTLAGGSIDEWWRLIWRFYPTLVCIAVLERALVIPHTGVIHRSLPSKETLTG